MENYVYIYRLYDVAQEFDLNALEEVLGRVKPTKHFRLQRVKPRSITVERPPVTVEWKERELVLPNGVSVQGRIMARLFDLGVVSLVWGLRLPSDLTYEQLKDLAVFLTETSDLESMFFSELKSLLAILEATGELRADPDFYEDFIVYFFQELDPSWDLVPVLLGEREALSEAVRHETLRYSFAYGQKDLAVITWNSALVYDADGSRDVLELLEFASVQLLELRYYDELLSQQLKAMYEALEQAGAVHWYIRLRRYRRLMRWLMEMVVEVTETTERIQNLLKVTEDVFYARVYGGALAAFRTNLWMNSIKQKIEVIERNYSMMSNEITNQQSTLLELAIVLLILFEIVMGLWRGF